MKRHAIMILGLAAVALFLLGSTATATTTPLIINDGSFENLGNPDGSTQAATDAPALTGYYDNTDPDNPVWVAGNDFNNNDIGSGQWAWVNGGDYPVEWRPTIGAGGALPLAPPNGAQVLASADGGSGVGFGGEIAVEQTLGEANPVLGFLKAGAVYTITVVGTNIPGMGFEGIYPGFGDMTHQGEIAQGGIDEWDQTGLAPGQWATISFSINADDYIGGHIKAGDELAAFLDIGGGVAVDSVSVTVTTADVPEPSTLVLLASGLVGLLAYAWRKRK